MVELTDIFRRHGPAYRDKFKGRMPRVHLAAMEAIENCRTEALGGHVYRCVECSELEYAYHSCGNRACPKCQNSESSAWIAAQQEHLVPTPYFMITFTLPAELRLLVRTHQKTFYSMMFRASASALKTLARDPRHLGGELGFVGVLQTWSRDLSYHPHIHYLAPGGVLSLDGSEWIPHRYRDWLLPGRALAALFRGKLRALLRKTAFYDQTPRRVWKKNWTVDCEQVGRGPEALTYLAPYVHRVAITNKRIKNLHDGHVTFQVKNRTTNRWEDRTLPAEEFIRRFLQHVLPKGFQKVRYYGFLHPNRKATLNLVRRLLGSYSHEHSTPDGDEDQPKGLDDEIERSRDTCRKCGGLLVHLRRLPKTTRAPPGVQWTAP